MQHNTLSRAMNLGPLCIVRRIEILTDAVHNYWLTSCNDHCTQPPARPSVARVAYMHQRCPGCIYAPALPGLHICTSVARKEMDCLQFIFCALFMPGIIIIESICFQYPWYDTQGLYLVSMIHNIYVRITSLILCIVHPIASNFHISNYWKTATLVFWSLSRPEIFDRDPPMSYPVTWENSLKN